MSLYVLFRSTYILFLHLYDGLVVVVKSKLTKVTRRRRRQYIMWVSHVSWIVPAKTGRSVLISVFWLCHPCGNCFPQHYLHSTDTATTEQTRTQTCTKASVLTLVTLRNKLFRYEIPCVRREGGWIYLDCQGVITPSSGPPINTSFLILRKFFFHSEIETGNTINYTKTVI